MQPQAPAGTATVPVTVNRLPGENPNITSTNGPVASGYIERQLPGMSSTESAPIPNRPQSEWIFIGNGTVMNDEGFMRDM